MREQATEKREATIYICLNANCAFMLSAPGAPEPRRRAFVSRTWSDTAEKPRGQSLGSNAAGARARIGTRTTKATPGSYVSAAPTNLSRRRARAR